MSKIILVEKVTVLKVFVQMSHALQMNFKNSCNLYKVIK